MSELHERKKAFYRTLVVHGIGHPGHLKKALPLGSDVPQEKLEKWLHRFTRVREMKFPEQIRNVNRFKLGADPEFVFASSNEPNLDDPEGNGRANAAGLGLKQGLAFGADNNGRLAEIRPYPSRSALETCASVLATLKWMAISCPTTMKYRWLSGAFIFRDGIGGHVHFGRKRPTRELEVRALDALSELMIQFSIYPVNEIGNRRRGDARGQRYGMPGDFRLQRHGYEYRTFPSWLDSPELAFLTLTLSKLVVYDPGLFLQMDAGVNLDRRWQQLMNFLAFYKGVDDDARICFLMVQRAMPRHQGGDFKGRWGIAGIKPDLNLFIPSSIKPHPDDVKNLFELFVHGTKLTPYTTPPTWTPVRLPRGYSSVLSYTETTQMKGLGELLCKMVVHEGNEIVFNGGREHTAPVVLVGGGLVKRLRSDWNKDHPILGEAGGGHHIIMPQVVREGPLARQAKEALLSGIFPIWDAEKVQEDSYEKWEQSVKEAVLSEKAVKLKGKVLLDEVQEGKVEAKYVIHDEPTPPEDFDDDFGPEPPDDEP